MELVNQCQAVSCIVSLTLRKQQWYQQMHVSRPYIKIILYTKFLHFSANHVAIFRDVEG
jgi:hypothetical protein